MLPTENQLRYRYRTMFNQPKLSAPALSYQYNPDGELSDGEELPFTPNLRDYFREDFERRYAHKPGAWERFRALLQQHHDKLPDNSHAQKDAWFVGIGDGGGDVAACFDRYERWLEALREAEVKDSIVQAERAAIQTTCTVTAQPTKHHDGMLIELEVLATGERLRFCCRNVFDVGYVINPDYAILPGAKKGGLHDGDYWSLFTRERGWTPVRPLTAAEQIALKYLYTFPPAPMQTHM